VSDLPPIAVIAPTCPIILKNAQSGIPVSLSASASHDPDDHIQSMVWKNGSSVISSQSAFSWLPPSIGTSAVLSLQVMDRYGLAGTDSCVIPATRTGVTEVCGAVIPTTCGECEDLMNGVCKDNALLWSQGPEWEAIQVRRSSNKAFFLVQTCAITEFEDDQFLYLDLDNDTTTGFHGFEKRIVWDYLRLSTGEPSTRMIGQRWNAASQGWVADSTILQYKLGSGASSVTDVFGKSVAPQTILELAVTADANVPSRFRWAMVGAKYQEGILSLPNIFYDNSSNSATVDGNPVEWR